MILALVFGAMIAADVPSPEPIAAYQHCLEQVYSGEQSLEQLVDRVRADCAAMRIQARDQLAERVADKILRLEQRRPPAGDVWKNELIDDATVRWLNGIAHQRAAAPEAHGKLNAQD